MKKINLLGLTTITSLAIAGCQANQDRVRFGQYDFEPKAFDTISEVTTELGIPMRTRDFVYVGGNMDENGDFYVSAREAQGYIDSKLSGMEGKSIEEIRKEMGRAIMISHH